MVDKKNKNGSFIACIIIALVTIPILIISWPIVGAVKVTLITDKTEVKAGDLAENTITFTTWINLSNPDAYIPMQRVFLNITGNFSRSFSFDLNGGDVQGQAFDGEINVTAGGDSLGPDNFGYGLGYGYDFNTGQSYNFGYGYGYGYVYGSGIAPLNRSYTISLNTSRMFDGSYAAKASIYTANSVHLLFESPSINFTVLPRLITAEIPSIPANSTQSSGLTSTPVGDFEWIVATNSTASPVILNVTISVNPPAGATNISSAFAGAIPDLYFNISVNNSAWFANLSHVQFRAYYNESKIPSNVDENTLRAYRFATTWQRLDCAGLGGCNATLNDGAILYAAGVNSTGNYVWANLSRFSPFAVAGTVTVTVTASTATSTSSGSGGGGGGGGGASAENYSNIEVKEKYDLHIFKDKTTSYKFANTSNPILFVNITGNANAGEITASVEVLRNTSSLVKIPVPGTVYKNVNIWVGTSGFAVPKNIKEAVIAFKVLNSWIEVNKFANSDVRMVKWDGSQWVQLETAEKTRDSIHTYYEAKTDSFSSFAITGLKRELVPTSTPPIEATGTPGLTGTATQTEKADGFKDILTIAAVLLVIIIAILAALYVFKQKKE